MMLSCACPLGNFSFTEDEYKIQISGPFAETRSSLASLKALCTCCLLQRILGNQVAVLRSNEGGGGGWRECHQYQHIFCEGHMITTRRHQQMDTNQFEVNACAQL